MTIAKVILSGSTDGRQLEIAATATAGDLVHTAHATSLDEVWLWAAVAGAVAADLTIEWGGVTSTDDLSKVTIPAADGYKLVIPGLLITNSLVVRAFASSTNLINVVGYVNRHTP